MNQGQNDFSMTGKANQNRTLYFYGQGTENAKPTEFDVKGPENAATHLKLINKVTGQVSAGENTNSSLNLADFLPKDPKLLIKIESNIIVP